MIPIAMPVLEKAEAEAAREAVLSGWVSQGPQVAAFEREFAALVGAPMPVRSRTARPRFISRCWPWVSVPAMR